MSTSEQTARLLAAVEKSTDRKWLLDCRQFNKAAAEKDAARRDVVEAVTKRILALDFDAAIEPRPTGGSLDGRVAEALRVYEAVLSLDRGRKTIAGHTRKMLRNRGSRGALIHILQQDRETSGLQRLAEYGRLDCSYEQIAIDFAVQAEIPHEIIESAKRRLAQLGNEETEVSTASV